MEIFARRTGTQSTPIRASLDSAIARGRSCVSIMQAPGREGRRGLRDDIAARIGQIDEVRLRDELAQLVAIGSREAGRPSAAAAVDHLARRLEDAGHQVERRVFGAAAGELNLVVEVPGRDPGPAVELCAHHDAVPGTPGADDNASGVVAVLEAARVLRGAARRRAIRLCLFGREESGMLGSRAHAADVAARGGVDGVFVLEMIGFRTRAPGSQRSPLRVPLVFSPPRVGDFIAVVGNFSSRALPDHFVRAARRYVPGLPVFPVRWLGGFLRDAARSDHLPYWQKGMRGAMITDTAELRNPHYHRPSDTPDTLDYPFLCDVTRAVVATVLEMAERPRWPWSR